MLLALLLAAAVEPLTLSLPPFEATGLPEGEAAYWAALFANGMRQQGVALVPDGGIDGTVRGQISRVASSGVRVDLRAQDPEGVVLAAFSMTAQKQGEVPELLQRAAQEISGELFRRTHRMPVPQKAEGLPPAPDPPSAATRLRPGVALGIVVAVLGAGALAGGIGLVVTARNQLSAVARGTPSSYFAAQQEARGAKDLSTVGSVLLGTGGVLFVGGLLYALYSGRVDTFFSITAMLAPEAQGIGFTGVFP